MGMTEQEMRAESLELITQSVKNFEEVALQEMKSMCIPGYHRIVVLDKIQVMKDVTSMLNSSDVVQESQLGFLLCGIVSIMLDDPTMAADMLKSFSDSTIRYMTLAAMKREKSK